MSAHNGFHTHIWGPPWWFTLHTSSFNYPLSPTDEDQRSYYTWIAGLCDVLPCGPCRNNIRVTLRKLGFSRAHLRNRAAFSRFVYDMHCEVNASLGRDSPTFEAVRALYETFRVDNSPKLRSLITVLPMGCHDGEGIIVHHTCVHR
jgi:hypothetical protein